MTDLHMIVVQARMSKAKVVVLISIPSFYPSIIYSINYRVSFIPAVGMAAVWAIPTERRLSLAA